MYLGIERGIAMSMATSKMMGTLEMRQNTTGDNAQKEKAATSSLKNVGVPWKSQTGYKLNANIDASEKTESTAWKTNFSAGGKEHSFSFTQSSTGAEQPKAVVENSVVSEQLSLKDYAESLLMGSKVNSTNVKKSHPVVGVGEPVKPPRISPTTTKERVASAKTMSVGSELVSMTKRMDHLEKQLGQNSLENKDSISSMAQEVSAVLENHQMKGRQHVNEMKKMQERLEALEKSHEIAMTKIQIQNALCSKLQDLGTESVKSITSIKADMKKLSGGKTSCELKGRMDKVEKQMKFLDDMHANNVDKTRSCLKSLKEEINNTRTTIKSEISESAKNCRRQMKSEIEELERVTAHNVGKMREFMTETEVHKSDCNSKLENLSQHLETAFHAIGHNAEKTRPLLRAAKLSKESACEF